MTTLQTDAATTSTRWMTPNDLDRILASTWKTVPSAPPRSFGSDAEVRSSVQSAEKMFAAFFALGVLVTFATLVRRVSSISQPGRLRSPVPRPAAKGDRLLESVRRSLGELSAADVQQRAAGMVDRLATELGRLTLTGLPDVHSNVGTDGAFLIEWTVGRRRIGLNIEPQASESSWYYASVDPAEVASASGSLTELDLPVLLRRLVHG
jgi:hypothetical protein